MIVSLLSASNNTFCFRSSRLRLRRCSASPSRAHILYFSEFVYCDGVIDFFTTPWSKQEFDENKPSTEKVIVKVSNQRCMHGINLPIVIQSTSPCYSPPLLTNPADMNECSTGVWRCPQVSYSKAIHHTHVVSYYKIRKIYTVDHSVCISLSL